MESHNQGAVDEALLKQLLKSAVKLPPVKSFQAAKNSIHEVVFELEVDECKYCLVRSQPAFASPIHLSSRELAIAQLIAKGLPNKCISTSLKISQWTVNTYLRRIFGKLGVTSRAAMVMRLMEAGLLEIDEHASS